MLKVYEDENRNLREAQAPPGPSMKQRDAVQALIEYGNKTGQSDFTMAKAICWKIFNWCEEREKADDR